MGTTEIGAMIIALRTESAQFRAEMDKGKEALKGVGTHAALSSRQMARFAAIAAENVVPGLQGSRQAVEGFVQVLITARGAMGALALVSAGFAAALAGFALGNIIRNFIDLQKAGFGIVESLKLAVGITKDYEKAAKDATEAQKKFTDEMARQRGVRQGISKELATLTDDYRLLVKIAAQERQARIDTLPLGERRIAQLESEKVATIQLRAEQEKRDLEIIEAMQKQREERAKEGTGGAEAATALGLAPSGLILGRQAIGKFKENISALATEIKNLAVEGVPARDIFTQIAEAQAKVDEQIATLKEQFKDVPSVFNQLVDIERQVGGGGLTKSLDGIVKSTQKLETGTARVEDQFGNLITSTGKVGIAFGDAGDEANFFAGVLFEDIPTAVNTAQNSIVVVTGRIRDLAEAFAFASREALFFETVVGGGGTIAPAAPGNF